MHAKTGAGNNMLSEVEREQELGEARHDAGNAGLGASGRVNAARAVGARTVGGAQFVSAACAAFGVRNLIAAACASSGALNWSVAAFAARGGKERPSNHGGSIAGRTRT